MVIVDLACRAAGSKGCRVFTLDTGRLPEETYRMMGVVRERYGIPVEQAWNDTEAFLSALTDRELLVTEV